jgi:hypothetical protein
MEAGRRRLADDEAVAERREVELATTSWHSLLAGAQGEEIALATVTGSEVAGRVLDQGAGWCLLGVGGWTVVVLEHVVWMKGVVRAAPPQVVRRGLGSLVRRWARARQQITVELVDGRIVDGRVGLVLSDALTLVTPAGQTTIPFSALVCLRGPRLDDDG